MTETAHNADHLQHAKESLEQLREKLDLSDTEVKHLGKNRMKRLDEMIEKVENGVVEIAVFGEVSAGKSALLNALLDKKAFKVGAFNGVTTTKDKERWNIDGYKDSKVVLVDTPGINEVDGESRAKIAFDAISTSDIILFIAKGDLTGIEFDALKQLHSTNKPIIVAVNKIDLLTEKQKKQTFSAINEKLDGIVNQENIVGTSGLPKPVAVIIQKPDGSEEMQERTPKPYINEIRKRIVALLPEWQRIVALNSSLFAANLDDESMAIKIAHRKKLADMETYKYAILKGAAAGLNPIPLVDMVIAVPIDYLMVNSIAGIYSTNMSFKDNQDLVIEIIYSNALKLGGVELATTLASTVAKFFTLGASQLVFAIPQGLVAAWTSYIIGKSTDVYFAQESSWGEGGAKKVVQDIIDSTDRDSLISELKVGIVEMLQNKEVLKKELKKAKKAAREANDKEGESWLDEIGGTINSFRGKLMNIIPFMK